MLWYHAGGALAVILSSILESSQNHPAFTDLQPFDYTISIAGLKSRDPKNAVYYTHLLQGRNLQVIGRADAIVSDERSAELITCAAQPRVEYHQGCVQIAPRSLTAQYINDVTHDSAFHPTGVTTRRLRLGGARSSKITLKPEVTQTRWPHQNQSRQKISSEEGET